MAEEKPKPQLHQSAMNMLSRCGQQYFYRYVEKKIIPPGVALVIGSSTHKSVEADLQCQIENGELLTVEQVKDIARDEFEGRWFKGVSLNKEEGERGLKAVKGEAIDTTVSLAELHRVDLAPKLKPTAVERKWVVKLDGYPMDLSGTIDIQEGAERIRDTKTAAKSPVATAADDSLQLTMYGLAVKVIDNQAPQEFVLDTLVKTKTPKTVTQISYRTDADYQMILRRVERSIEIIDRQAFYPADPSNWACSERFCGYWNICPFAKRPVTITMSKGGKE